MALAAADSCLSPVTDGGCSLPMRSKTLPREVSSWILSLELSLPVVAPKWDLTNGFLIGEIFQRYYPHDRKLKYIGRGLSLRDKTDNWFFLKEFLKRRDISVPEELIYGTIHCKHEAAEQLIRLIYELLTSRPINAPPPDHKIDFTNHAYQHKLPAHAQATATSSVKSNIMYSEILDAIQESSCAKRSISSADPPGIVVKSKALLNNYLCVRRQQRLEDPVRFDRRPTLGELARRHSPPPDPLPVAPTPADQAYLCPEEDRPSLESPPDTGALSGERDGEECACDCNCTCTICVLRHGVKA